MSDPRATIRSTAQYLRQVRPIDPAEFVEYVEDSISPADVRAILREEAVSLGLVERDDGTFVPVDDDPVEGVSGPITRFPVGYVDTLESHLVAEYGTTWAEGASGERLRSRIRQLKDRYLRGAAVAYDADTSAGYAIYHLPAYYAAIQYALDDLAERDLLERSLRVLDVGAGVGGPALGLCDALPNDALLEYHAVEPGAGADILEALLETTGQTVDWTVTRERIEDVEPSGPYDLVLLCNVLSELAAPASVLRDSLEWIADDGTVLAMAPADRETSIQLRELERTVEGEHIEDESVTVYGPTVRFWPDHTPSDRGWSFDVRDDLAVPTFQRRLDRMASDPEHEPGEFVNVDVQFSYSLLRRDGRRHHDISLDPSRFARMADMDQHVTNRIDLVAAKLSHNLAEPGANPLYKVSDGSEQVDHYAVRTADSTLTDALPAAAYGDPLVFEGVLALWNEDEESYNLVVDDETMVDPVA